MDNTAATIRLKNYRRVLDGTSEYPPQYDKLLPGDENKITLSKLMFLYLIGGLIGTLWETVLNFLRGDGFVYCNGSLFTLLNPVYGIGAVVIVLALGSYRNPLAVFIIGAVMGAVVEYLLSCLEEVFLGTRSWDYTGDPMNIGGRTTVPLAMLWGVICLVVICYVFPSYNRFLNRLPRNALRTVSAVLLCVVIADFTCTAVVLFRYTDRMNGAQPTNRVEEFIDKHFSDEYMQTHFPQMKPGEKSGAKAGGHGKPRKPKERAERAVPQPWTADFRTFGFLYDTGRRPPDLSGGRPFFAGITAAAL